MQTYFVRLIRGLWMVVELSRAILMHKAVPDGIYHIYVYFIMRERFRCCPPVPE